MMQAKILGAPEIFLREFYPHWKNNKTYMVPPKYTGDATIDGGEEIIYDLLEQLGDLEQTGMIVIHGFQLRDLPKFNEKCKSEVPSSLLKSRISDFVIFDRTLGIISLEVINLVKVDAAALLDAKDKLESSHDLITKLAAYGADDNYFFLPHKKIIVMPFTKTIHDGSASFEDTLILSKKDCQNIDSFQMWWHDKLQKPNPVHFNEQTQEAYERALSYSLMIRHLGPVTETDFMSYFDEALVSHKYKQATAIEDTFPELWSWLWDILAKKDTFESKQSHELRAFMKNHDLKLDELRSMKGLQVINDLLKQSKYICGDSPCRLDDAIAIFLVDTSTPSLIFGHILRFIRDVWHVQTQVIKQTAVDQSKVQEQFPFLKLRSLEDLRNLNQHLKKSTFIEGDAPSELDRELFETLTCKTRMKHSRLPMVMTSDQLAVFEGPLKQIIIGPPGSGKTELMKFKALELELEMKICNEEKRILFILANGDPEYLNEDSLLFYHIKEFFESGNSTLVDIVTVVLDGDPEFLDKDPSYKALRKKMESGVYGHVFIDEYWIGSKPHEHMILIELITKIPGYVWISSVHDYSTHPNHSKKITIRTQPLVTALEKKGGVVSRITKVLRATNAIIDIERRYIDQYEHRPFIFGTKEVLGHSFEGLPVTWAVEKSIDGMYARCADIVADATGYSPIPHATNRERLMLYPDDVLVVNFAIRTAVSMQAEHSLKEHLNGNGVPVWTFGDSLEQFKDCGVRKVSLVESLIREISCFVDGVEWPLVVVILPHDLLMQKAELAPGAQKLRNYDPFISFFRVMVKLVIISDKWKNSEEFLDDLAKRSRM
jgi:hypothetical protein